MKKVTLSYLAYTVCAIALVISGAIFFVISTQTGLECVWYVATKIVPGHLTANQLRGKLGSHLTLKDVHYSYNDIDVRIKSLYLKWDGYALLLRKRIVVNDLQTDQIVIKLPQDNPQKNSDAPSQFQFEDTTAYFQYARLDKARISDLSIWKNQAEVVNLKKVVITQNPDHSHHILLESSLGNLLGQYSIKYAPEFRWKMNLQGNIAQIKEIVASLNGKINFAVKSSGSWSKKSKVADLEFSHITGEINHYPLQVNAKIRFLDDNYNIDKIFIHLGNAILKGSGTFNQLLDASWTLDIPNLKTIYPQAQGTISSSGKVSGSREHPEITANINANNIVYQPLKIKSIVGQIHTKLFSTSKIENQGNIEIKDISFDLYKISVLHLQALSTFSNNKLINQLTGDFKMGDGLGSLDGTLTFSPEDILAQLAIKGDNLQMTNTAEYKLKASPDIQLSYEKQSLNIKGKVIIPYADIQPEDFSDNVTTLPSQVVIVNEAAPSTTALMDNLSLSVNIIIQDKINLKYSGLHTKLKGELLISQIPGNSPTGIGELITVDGLYHAYGRMLHIQTGRLIYAGNLLSNPGLDIRATQSIKSIAYSGKSEFDNTNVQPVYSGSSTQTVGVSVRGTLQKPVITLFSDPGGLSQADILSYLVLGYPQSQATAGGSSLALLNIATKMHSGSDVEDIGSTIQKKIGLNDLSVGSTDYYDASSNSTQSTTTANIGKDIGRHLSLHYSVGLFEPVSILSLRYKINKYFTIKSETSTLENGGDIMYHVESDD